MSMFLSGSTGCILNFVVCAVNMGCIIYCVGNTEGMDVDGCLPRSNCIITVLLGFVVNVASVDCRGLVF